MKLSEIKKILDTVQTVEFELENGSVVPEHFHVTEIGIVTKHFIDCGGTVRNEKVANFQLWDANDFDHRLKPAKLQKIIALSEKVLGLDDFEIEVEYQTDTIGKYELGFNGDRFILLSKKTACLAKDNCGSQKEKLQLHELQNTCCSTDGSCC
jgi:hypothetical protein